MSTLVLEGIAVPQPMRGAGLLKVDRSKIQLPRERQFSPQEKAEKAPIHERRRGAHGKTGEKSGDKIEEKALDDSLVERARNGETDAFRQLVDRYQKRAHAIALGIVGNYEDAEDITQDAFLKAYRNLSSFRGQSSFYTWLYRIIFNLSIDLSRKAYRRSERSLEDTVHQDAALHQATENHATLQTAAETPHDHLHRMEIRDRFTRALNELSPEHRTVIVLREVEGLSYAEISEAVGCSKGTVMSRLHHARRRLQRTLRELFPATKALQGESDAVEYEDESSLR